MNTLEKNRFEHIIAIEITFICPRFIISNIKILEFIKYRIVLIKHEVPITS